jgi:hypothetical protein
VFSPTAASIAADSMVARRRKECYEKQINYGGNMALTDKVVCGVLKGLADIFGKSTNKNGGNGSVNIKNTKGNVTIGDINITINIAADNISFGEIKDVSVLEKLDRCVKHSIQLEIGGVTGWLYCHRKETANHIEWGKYFSCNLKETSLSIWIGASLTDDGSPNRVNIWTTAGEIKKFGNKNRICDISASDGEFLIPVSDISIDKNDEDALMLLVKEKLEQIVAEIIS